MSTYLQATDTIIGKEGKVIATIDNRVVEWGEISKLEATVELLTKEVPILGQDGLEEKIIGWKGTGSVTFYYGSELVTSAIKQYIKTKKYPKIKITVIVEDPASGFGKREVLLDKVVFKKGIIALIDISADSLEVTSDFTYASYEELTTFKQISG